VAGERFSGVALGSIAVGALFAYAGIKGYSIPNTIKALISGQSPAGQSQATPVSGTVPASTTASTTASGNVSTTAVSGSNEAVLQQVAAQFGWTGAEWTALYNVEMAEAGFSLTAQNPSSGAYGMAQFINGASEYATYGGNSTTAQGQATGMCNYVKQRYGKPSVAWAHEQQYGWY
jgi:hypothetical protein